MGTERMGPLPIVLKYCIRRLSIAISSTLLLVAIAHGQVSRAVSPAAGDSQNAPPAQNARAESFA